MVVTKNSTSPSCCPRTFRHGSGQARTPQQTTHRVTSSVDVAGHVTLDDAVKLLSLPAWSARDRGIEISRPERPLALLQEGHRLAHHGVGGAALRVAGAGRATPSRRPGAVAPRQPLEDWATTEFSGAAIEAETARVSVTDGEYNATLRKDDTMALDERLRAVLARASRAAGEEGQRRTRQGNLRQEGNRRDPRQQLQEDHREEDGPADDGEGSTEKDREARRARAAGAFTGRR